MEHPSFQLYGKISYYHQGYAGLKPRITFKRISNEPAFFTETVECIIVDPFGLWEHIMKSCDQSPESTVDWIEGKNSLVHNETESFKKSRILGRVYSL